MDVMKVEIWKAHQLYCLFALCLWFSYTIFKKHKLVGVAVFYMLVNPLITFHTNVSWGRWQLNIDFTSALAFAMTILLVTILSQLNLKKLDRLITILCWVNAINAVIVLFNGFGIFNNHTMDTTVLAMVLPLYLRGGRMVGWVLASFSLYIIYLQGEVMAAATLAAVIFGYLIATIPRAKGISLTVILSSIAGLAYYYFPRVDHGSRPAIWARIMGWWWENANHWFGAGGGAYQWLGPWSQMTAGAKTDIAMSLHNDHLQLIYDYGFIGYALLAMVYIRALWLARARPWVFSFLVGASVAMLGYFPLQYLVSELMILCILCVALYPDQPVALLELQDLRIFDSPSHRTH